MGTLFQILLIVSAFGVAGAAMEVRRRRKEVRRMRDEYGDAYDEVRKRWKL